jgi:hypothetical protein
MLVCLTDVLVCVIAANVIACACVIACMYVLAYGCDLRRVCN